MQTSHVCSLVERQIYIRSLNTLNINKIIDVLTRRYRWYIADPLARRPFQNLKNMDSFESIQYIIDHRCSISRYGDGELLFFWGVKEGYQEVNDKLVSSLKHVL